MVRTMIGRKLFDTETESSNIFIHLGEIVKDIYKKFNRLESKQLMTENTIRELVLHIESLENQLKTLRGER